MVGCRWVGAAVLGLALMAVGACGADEPANAETNVEAAAEAPPLDRAAASQKVLLLYGTRQEFIERYYGPNGVLNTSDEALGRAIEESEARFHELMALVRQQPPAPASELRAAAEAVVAAHERVLELAEQTGVPPKPPNPEAVANTPSGGLENWIEDIRRGFAELGLIAADAPVS